MKFVKRLVTLTLCGVLMLSSVGHVSASVEDLAEKYTKQRIKIACIGDSVTEGVGGTPYPQQLQTKLSQYTGGSPYFEVKNFGLSGTAAQDDARDQNPNDPYTYGYRTVQLPPNCPDWMNPGRVVITGGNGKTIYEQSKMYEADIYIISLGGNDGKACNWKNGNNNFEEDYRALIEEYVNMPHHPIVIVGTSPAIYKDNFTISADVVNEEIVPLQKEIAADMGLMLVDTHTPTFGQESYYIDDGVHMNATGYGVVADQYYYAIAAMVESLSSADLTSFAVGDYEGEVDSRTDSVYLSLPEGTTLTNVDALAKVGLVEQKLEGIDLSEPYTFTATSADKTDECEYTVYTTIGDKTATGIAMETLPTTLEYALGTEDMDVTGGTVKVTFDDESSVIVPLRLSMLRGFYGNQLGTHDITVSLYSKTTTFDVTVVKAALLGDVDSNEKVNTTDARKILQYAAESIGEDELDLSVADVNGDDKVNTSDARKILQYSAGLIEEL